MTSCNVMLEPHYCRNPRHDWEEIANLQWHENRKKINWQLNSTMHQLWKTSLSNVLHQNNFCKILIFLSFLLFQINQHTQLLLHISCSFVESKCDISFYDCMTTWYLDVLAQKELWRSILLSSNISGHKRLLIPFVPFIKVMLTELSQYPNQLFW